MTLKTQIAVQDIESVADFYTHVFGMEVVDFWDNPDDRGLILKQTASGDEALLELYEEKSPQSYQGISLQFKIPDMATFIASLPKGMVYSGPKRRPWGATYLYLTDPAGVRVIAYEIGGP